MLYELISDADYDGLPEEPEARFVAFEAVCRANMTRFITQDTSRDSDTFVRMQYMTTVAGAAEVLGIEDIRYPDWLADPSDGIVPFMLSVSRQTARIRLMSQVRGKAFSVKLASHTRGQIEKQIQNLRELINSEPMCEDKRAKLLKRLDDLSVELSQNRVSFSKVMIILAHVSLGVINGTSFLANAPHAIATISSLLGADKEAEEAEARRLGPPPKPKALPAPSTSLDRGGERINEIIDDDIPF